MRVLAFRHVPFEGPGLIEDALAAHGIGLDYADLHLDSADAPDAASYDGLLFMGGPMSVNDNLAYLRAEEEIIRAAAERGLPVLGICLGAQLIARALGGKVRRNPAKEIGWYEIECTAAAAKDALLGGLERETVLHWHGETFEPPPGAELLASSVRCHNQAYRLGEGVYGFQFHLEVTPEMIADWCRQASNRADVRELKTPIDPHHGAERMRELSARVFGGWCRIVQRYASGGRSTI